MLASDYPALLLNFQGLGDIQMNRKLGFIGLGNMGLPMSINLLKANYEVYGFDTNTKAKKGALLIDFSTVNPDLNDSLHKEASVLGLRYLGAPVSGGVIGAINASLTIMVGGSKEDYESASRIFGIVGKNTYHLGLSSSVGTRLKLLNNLMIGFYTEAVAETIVLGEKMGIDGDTLYEVLSNSYGQSRIYERNYMEYMKNNDYAPGFSTNLLLKDLKLAKEMADEAGVSLRIGEKLVELYSEIAQQGYGENDMSAAYLSLKDTCKIKQL